MVEQLKAPVASTPAPVAPPARLTISSELVQRIVSFLVQHPWAQVNEIITGIQRDVKPLTPADVRPLPELDRRAKKSGNGDLGDRAEG